VPQKQKGVTVSRGLQKKKLTFLVQNGVNVGNVGNVDNNGMWPRERSGVSAAFAPHRLREVANSVTTPVAKVAKSRQK